MPPALAETEVLPRFHWEADRYEEAIRLATTALEAIFDHGHDVRTQLPLRLGADSLPEPDVAVVRGSIRDFARVHPRTAVLLVEVADSTLAFDRRRKLAFYARNGIPEYWIVNLPDAWVEVRRQPAGETYGEQRVFRSGEQIPVGGGLVAVADLLP